MVKYLLATLPHSEISLGKHLKNYSEVVGALHDLWSNLYVLVTYFLVAPLEANSWVANK